LPNFQLYSEAVIPGIKSDPTSPSDPLGRYTVTGNSKNVKEFLQALCFAKCFFYRGLLRKVKFRPLFRFKEQNVRGLNQ